VGFLPDSEERKKFLLRHDFVDAVTRDDRAVLGDLFRLINVLGVEDDETSRLLGGRCFLRLIAVAARQSVG